MNVLLSLSFFFSFQCRWSPPVGPLQLALLILLYLQMLYGSLESPGSTPLRNTEGWKDWLLGVIAVTVELKTPFLFVVPLVEGE